MPKEQFCSDILSRQLEGNFGNALIVYDLILHSWGCNRLFAPRPLGPSYAFQTLTYLEELDHFFHTMKRS